MHVLGEGLESGDMCLETGSPGFWSRACCRISEKQRLGPRVVRRAWLRRSSGSRTGEDKASCCRDRVGKAVRAGGSSLGRCSETLQQKGTCDSEVGQAQRVRGFTLCILRAARKLPSASLPGRTALATLHAQPLGSAGCVCASQDGAHRRPAWASSFMALLSASPALAGGSSFCTQGQAKAPRLAEAA